MKSIRLGLILAMAVLVGSAAISVGQSKDKNLHPPFWKGGKMELKPSKKNKVKKSNLKVEVLENGSVHISDHGSRSMDDPPEAYEVQIDEQTGEYMIEPLDPNTYQPPPPRENHYYEIPELGASLRPIGFCPGTWLAYVHLMEIDPVNINLAYTESWLGWGVNGYGQTSQYWKDDKNWAAYPSGAGTYWSLIGQRDHGIWTSWNAASRYWQPCHAYQTSFENWNFNNPFSPTHVNHFIQICGRQDAWYDYWKEIWRDGDFHWALRTRVYTDGSLSWS